MVDNVRCPLLNEYYARTYGLTISGVEVFVSGLGSHLASNNLSEGQVAVLGCPDYNGKKCPHRDGDKDCMYKEKWK